MNGISLAEPTTSPGEVFYPCRDGEPMAETQVHLMLMLYTIARLRLFFSDRPDVYVIGNMFLYWEKGNPLARKAPDVMVVKGVEPKPPRDNFKIWEENATPCVIMELTSPSTAKEDLEDKVEVYRQIGVKEYFLFDPKHEYLKTQLMGYRLVLGQYKPIPAAKDGSLLSEELVMRLVPDGQDLTLIDLRTGERLLNPEEMHHSWREMSEELAKIRERTDEMENSYEESLKKAKDRADEAERRTKHLAAELERLKALLPPVDPPPDGKG